MVFRFLKRRLFTTFIPTVILAIASVARASEAPPTVVIEGRIESSVPPSEAPTVQVTSGEGAKPIDALVNELGLALKNMERLSELSGERQGRDWWLSPRSSSQAWQSQLHSDFSADQSVRARLLSGGGERRRVLVEGGFDRDRRDLVVLENRDNPFDASLAREARVANSRERAYAKLDVTAGETRTLADADTKTEDIHAGALLTGAKKSAQEGVSGKWRHGSFETLPFARGRQDEFESRLSPLLSNSTSGLRAGSQSKYEFANYTLAGDVSFEELERRYADQSRTRFDRYGAGATIAKTAEFEFADVKLHAGGEFASDHIDASAAPSRALRDSRRSLEPAVWDLGAEVSSPKRHAAGVVAKARRFALIPTPSQRFGDGALLAGADDLEPETGMRASFGPWLHTSTVELEVAGFYERIANAPLMVAVSPSSARTVALGGVWAQGFEARASAVVRAIKLQVLYTFQEALNASEISWQRGKPVPGRPRHVFKTGIDYLHPRWRLGADYGYRSEDALDLAGLWAKPPHHDLSAHLGYGGRDWEVRLAGAKLLAASNGLPSAQFSGQAAPDLLEPTIEQTEVRLQCEFLM